MWMRRLAVLVLLLLVVVTGCSTTKGDAHSPSNSPSVAQPSLGTIVGTVQIALGSGDVKSLAFKPVRLVQEAYSVLTDSQKQEIAYDEDQDSKALSLGVISLDEFKRRGQAKVDALQAFQERLPEEQAIQAVSSVTTDANGNFEFEGIRPGTYWIFLDADVSGNYVGWAVRVDVAPNVTVKANLNNTNLDYGFR